MELKGSYRNQLCILLANNNPIGQDSWNRSKESRQHPELHSSGHGTVDLPWSSHTDNKQDSKTNSNSKMSSDEEEKQDKKQHNLGGHTRKREYLPRSVKRDLNNI